MRFYLRKSVRPMSCWKECTLPTEETFEWGRRGDRRPLEDLPDLFYDFCWERAAELRAQIKSMEGIEEEPRVTALPSGYPRWLGPCVLGEICGATTCRRCARCSRP